MGGGLSYSEKNEYKKKFINQIEFYFEKCDFDNNQDIINLKNNIINITKKYFDGGFPKISQEKIIKSNTAPKIEVFTSEKIQKKNKEITTEFEKISYDYNNDDDKNENYSIAQFLIEAANISRSAFNESNIHLKKVFNDFKNNQKETTIISSKEHFKKIFSSWVKKNNIIENIINNHNIDFNYIEDQSDKKKMKYFYKLYNDLLTLYFQCAITFPSIEIDFNTQNNFESNIMIDYLNKGSKNKKVNFVIFPSLYSNGKFLDNGKKWVFTYFDDYKKKTFYFKQLNLIQINKENIFQIPNLSEILKLNLKTFIIPSLNYKISNEINQKFVFYLKNKNTNKIEKEEIFIKEKHFNPKISITNNYEFIKCEYYMQDELII